MAQQVFGPAAVVSVLNRAFTNTSPSNAVFNNQVATAGVTDASQLAFAKSFGSSFATGKTAADLSAMLMTNLGLDNAALATALTDYIAANGTQNVGVIAWQLSSILSNLENDATYGAAAKAWNAEVTGAYEYSSNTKNTTSSSGSTTGNEAGSSTVLTTGQDILTGSAGNDFFRGVAGQPIGAQEQTTFNSSDILDGGAGQDALILNLVGNYNGGARVKSIETLKLGINIAGFAAFDYNVNAGFNEISDVATIVADQINVGEILRVNNIVRTADVAGAKTLPSLSWENDQNNAAGLAGNVQYNIRAAEATGATDALAVNFSNVNNGDLDLDAGIEVLNITSVGSQNTLRSESNAATGNGNADLSTGGSLTTVNINATTAFGKAANVLPSATPILGGLTDRAVGSDVGVGLDATAAASLRASSSNLVSVEDNTTTVDATGSTAAVNIRFVKDGAVGRNVSFTGGDGNDYVEFELGNINAKGGKGADTFAFINTDNNSAFGSTDSIDGGEGADTIQIGVNGNAQTYNISATEFNNKGSIEVVDLRGQTNNITLSQEFVSKADTKLTIRTDKIIQTSDVDSSNDLLNTPAANLTLEDRAVTVLDTTNLDQNTGLIFLGGSGSDRLIMDNESFNQFVELDGGTNLGQNVVAGNGDYDTLTVRDSAVLDTGDLFNVKNFEGMVLVKNQASAQFSIDLSERFLLANTKTNDLSVAYGETGIRDQTFFIGTSAAANANALSGGDTVNVDITDLLTAGGALKTSLTANGGRGLDLTSLVAAGVTVNYIVNGAAATAAQINAVTNNDTVAARDSVVGSSPAIPAGNVPIVFAGVNGDTTSGFEISGNKMATMGNDTFVVNGLALSATAVINASGGAADVLQLNGTTSFDAATVIAGINSTEINGGTTMTLAQYGLLGTVTGTGAADSVTLTTAGILATTAASVETYNLGAAGNWTVTGASAGATGQTFNMGANLTNGDVVTGGTGTGDVLMVATGAAATDFDGVTGIETIRLGAGYATGVTPTAASAFVNATTPVTFDATAVTGGLAFDLRAVDNRGLTVNLNRTNGAADSIKVDTTVANVVNAHAVSGLGAGDKIDFTVDASQIHTVTIGAFNAATFAGDVNAQLATLVGYVASATGAVLVNVAGSTDRYVVVGNLTTVFGGLVDATDEVIKLVGQNDLLIDGASLV